MQLNLVTVFSMSTSHRSSESSTSQNRYIAVVRFNGILKVLDLHVIARVSGSISSIQPDTIDTQAALVSHKYGIEALIFSTCSIFSGLSRLLL